MTESQKMFILEILNKIDFSAKELPPIGWMWDYHPPKGRTPDFERIAEGSKDFTQWSTTEVLCNLEKGTMRAAVNGVELLRYVHPFPKKNIRK